MEQIITTTTNPVSYELSNAKSLLSLASELTRFIKEQKLLTNIKGKEFVNCEAWTFAGASMGLIPIPVSIEDLSNENEIKYKATVEVQNINTGAIVGRGFALCSNKEYTKKSFDEYAIASMAITRATGKAFRIPLGWLIKAAGFEPTPAEEMDFQQAEVVEEKKTKTVKQEPGLATSEQKAEIVKLLAHGLITNEERNKMTLGLNKLTEERAREAIINLNNKIEERESAIAHQIAEEQAA